MLDPDLTKQLDQINLNLASIEKKKNPGVWRAFFNGMFGALGYIAGIALVVIVIGYILQKTGQLQAFQEQIKNFTDVISQAKKLTAPEGSNPNPGSGGQSTITLPNGQQYKVNVLQ